jgi:secreted trypsin-like serine protease
MRTFLSLILFILFLCPVFGQYPESSQFNSSVIIEIKRTQATYTCSGVIVSKSVVLTAAHCLEGNVLRVRVFTQEKYHPKNPYLVVKHFMIHPDYDVNASNYFSDLGKIYLASKIPSKINIISIHPDRNFRGEIIRSGFGKRNNLNTRTNIVSFLKKSHPEEKSLQFYETDSQSGDSGGPIFLVQNNKISLIAIHSTLSFGPKGVFSLNPSIADFTNWIFDSQKH